MPAGSDLAVQFAPPSAMLPREPRAGHGEERVRNSFDMITSIGHFKRLADAGFIDLDEPRETILKDNSMQTCHSQRSRHKNQESEHHQKSLLTQQIHAEYSAWIHDAWDDFVEKMDCSTNRPTLRLGDDLKAYCSLHLAGRYHGKKICTRTNLTFRYVKLNCLPNVYQWKVTIEPVDFMPALIGSGSAMTTCSCILKCCCLQPPTRDLLALLET